MAGEAAGAGVESPTVPPGTEDGLPRGVLPRDATDVTVQIVARLPAFMVYSMGVGGSLPAPLPQIGFKELNMAKNKYGLSTRGWTREFRTTLTSLEAYCGSAGFSAKSIAKDPSAFFAVIKFVYGVETDVTKSFFQRAVEAQAMIENMPRGDRRKCQQKARLEIESVGLEKFGRAATAILQPVIEMPSPKPKKPKSNAPVKPVKPEKRESRRSKFYKSWDWRTLRMEALKRHGAVCQCCGAKRGDVSTAGEPIRICVDHIRPLATHWHMRLDPDNLQILCDECNMGKGAWDTTDWRDEGSILDDEPMSEIEMQLGERLH